MGEAMRWLTNLWWRFVFWWKHRAGFIDLQREITIEGVVVWTQGDAANPDGDFCFNVRPDAAYRWCVTAFGGRVTQENPDYPGTLHCEVAPWLPIDVSAVRVGTRVRVSGRWGFDGCHLGGAEWIDVLRGIIGHRPQIESGWLESHPTYSVTEIE